MEKGEKQMSWSGIFNAFREGVTLAKPRELFWEKITHKRQKEEEERKRRETEEQRQKAIDDFKNATPILRDGENEEWSARIGDKVKNAKNLKFKELCGEELTMRNLEYYLEGMLRRTFFEHKLHFCIKSDLDESDKIVLRLLDIDCRKGALGYDIIDNVSILKHIKDDYNKSKVTEQMIVSSLKRSLIVPQYTSEHDIIKKEETEDWILPGINPDINCLNPLNCYEKGASENKYVYTSRIENSIFSKIFEK